MPANRATLAAEQAYLARQRALALQVAQLVAREWQAVGADPADLAPAIRRFVARAAGTIELGQARAQDMAAAFTRQVVQLEARATLPAIGRDRQQIAGTTADGRSIASALSSVAPTVFLGIAGGRGLAAALGAGGSTAMRLAATEVADAGRREVDHQAEDTGVALSGWQWVVASAGGCAACMASSGGAVHDWGELMESHPWCSCIRTPVVAGVPDRVPRPSGEELFAAMSPAEQVATFHSDGEAKAELVRSGELSLADLIERRESHDWRATISERPLAAIAP